MKWNDNNFPGTGLPGDTRSGGVGLTAAAPIPKPCAYEGKPKYIAQYAIDRALKFMDRVALVVKPENATRFDTQASAAAAIVRAGWSPKAVEIVSVDGNGKPIKL